MRKVVLNISDTTYEKLRFESLEEGKSIPQILHDRIFYKPFSDEVEKSFSVLMDNEYQKSMGN